MKLLYLKEHLSCVNYQVTYNTGFVSYKLQKGENSSIDNESSFCVIFLLSGELSVDYGNNHISLAENEMVIIPQHISNKIKALTDSQLLLLFWNKDIRACSKQFVEALFASVKDTGNHVLPIRQPLLEVLESVRTYLASKLQCKHMHSLKQQEVLLILRGVYTKDELINFFLLVSGSWNSFEEFVINNYKKVNTVKEFAELYCTTERSFSRKFKLCFNESPYHWMQKKKAELIREKISEVEISFQDIAMDFNFKSQAHFSSYCKRMFGLTPSQLRNEDQVNTL